MGWEGVFTQGNVSRFIDETVQVDTVEDRSGQPVILDFSMVDRVDFEALAQLLIVVARLAHRRRPAVLTFPNPRYVQRERDYLAAALEPDATPAAYAIQTSVELRLRRRRALRLELVRNGFESALREAYRFCRFGNGLEVRGSPTSSEQDLVDLDAHPPSVPFQWFGTSQNRGLARSLALIDDLERVVSQGGRITNKQHARDLADYVAAELAKNVQQHAFPDGWDGPRLALVAAVSLFSAGEFKRDYGLEEGGGTAVYVCEYPFDRAQSVVQLFVGDTGQGIPATLPCDSRTDRARFDRWYPTETPEKANQRSVAYAFHPLSTSRQTVTEDRTVYRGLSFVNKIVRFYGGITRTRSGSAEVVWELSERRDAKTRTRSTFPGTAVCATLTLSVKAERTSSRTHRRTTTRSVPAVLFETDREADVLAPSLPDESSFPVVVAVSVDTPLHAPQSLDRLIARRAALIDATAAEWDRPWPWVALLPCDYSYAATHLVTEDEVTSPDSESSDALTTHEPFLACTIDGQFLWLGGTERQRRVLAAVYETSDQVASTTAEMQPQLEDLDAGRWASTAAALTIPDLAYAIRTGLANKIADLPEFKRARQAAKGADLPVLLSTLKVTHSLIDLDATLVKHGLVTGAAVVCVLGAEAAFPSYELLVHAKAFPTSVAALLQTTPVNALEDRDAPRILVVLEGIFATGNELRGQLSHVVKRGHTVAGVIALFDASGEEPQELLVVFRPVPLKFLYSAAVISDPQDPPPKTQSNKSAELMASALSNDPYEPLMDFLKLDPAAIHFGHFYRRGARHLDLFVDLSSLFAPSAALADIQDRIAADVIGRVRAWLERADYSPSPQGLLVDPDIPIFYPRDDVVRAKPFATWLASRIRKDLNLEATAQPLTRELDATPDAVATDSGVAILVDWGTVTFSSHHAMLVNIATRGFEHALFTALTTQLDPTREVLAQSISVIRSPWSDPPTSLNVETLLLGHVDLGHVPEHACQLCRITGELAQVATRLHWPQPLRRFAAEKLKVLTARPIPAPASQPSGIGTSESFDPARLLGLRRRLRASEFEFAEKYYLLRDLQQLAVRAQEPLTPQDTAELLAWAQLMAYEPQWMGGSHIDLGSMRTALSDLFWAYLTTDETERDGHADTVVLIALRVCGKSNFLKLLPILCSESRYNPVLPDAMLLLATFIDRNYHQTPGPLGQLATAVEGITTALASREDQDEVVTDSSSVLQVLQNLLTVYTRRADITSHQDAWRYLRTVYTAPMNIHEGIGASLTYIVALINSTSSAAYAALSDSNPTARKTAVRDLLEEPWEPSAKVLREHILPALPRIADQVTTLLDLKAFDGVPGLLDADRWRERLLSPDPAIFREVEDAFANLRNGSNTKDTYRGLHRLLRWCDWALMGEQTTNAGPVVKPVLHQLVESIPCSMNTVADIISAQLDDHHYPHDLFIDGERGRTPSAFISAIAFQRASERIIENIASHLTPDAGTANVGVRISANTTSVNVVLLNTATSAERAGTGNRRGLTAANRALNPFGATVRPIDPNLPGLPPPEAAPAWTFGVQFEFERWSFDEVGDY